MINAIHVLFQTGRFNLSKVGDHFINPCCFGEDVAAWLTTRLASKGVATAAAYHEDWGWELPANRGVERYYLCIGGNSDDLPANPDQGEWRIIVEKRRSIWQRMKGAGKISADDEMVRVLEEILTEPDIRGLRRE